MTDSKNTISAMARNVFKWFQSRGIGKLTINQGTQILDSEAKLKRELETFNECINVHELPEIFHYWSNKHLRPMLEEHGISHPDDLFANNMFDNALSCNIAKPTFVSIGSGNCDTEVRVAKLLKNKGLQEFCIDCIELNGNMLKRGYDLATQEGVLENLSFIESDFNNWKSNKEYASVIANHSLHHVQNLEGLFSEIKNSLNKNGSFIVNDMIGRNGHQRWPEALEAVNNFWKELPESYRYNHQLKRFEEVYENWDCSTEGFEGIRSQDILPLLVKNFHFQLFIGFGNVTDIFIDRGFGHNFDVNKKSDTDFIDKIHQFDEDSIRNGAIKPTKVMAVMKKHPPIEPIYSRGFSPKFCIREPSFEYSLSSNKKNVVEL